METAHLTPWNGAPYDANTLADTHEDLTAGRPEQPTMELIASLRFLARRKAVTAVAVMTMALALGANTAAIAVVRSFFFAALSVPDADRLVNIAPVRPLPGRGDVVFNDAWLNYELLRETQTAFEEVACLLQNVVGWDNAGDVRPLQATLATASFFRTMGVTPALGRAFTAEEEGPSPAPVAVISEALWRTAFGGDAGIVGRSLALNGTPTTVIGVMPAGFSQPVPTDIWLPFDIPASQRTIISGARSLSIYGRIAKERSHQAALADLDAMTKRSLELYAADNRDYRYTMRSLRDLLLNGADDTVLLIQAGALILLILAALNLSSLLVAWGFERQQEMAVRLALGGGRGEVMKLFLIQGALVVGAGCLFGLLVGQGALILVGQLELGPALGFFLSKAHLDLALFGTTAVAAGLAAIAASALPAWLARRPDLVKALRTSSRSASQSSDALRSQRGMVVLQSALSVVVLAAAVVVGISFRNLAGVPDGFVTENRDVARVILPAATHPSHEKRVAFATALLRALEAEPELRGHAFSSTLPVGDTRFGGRFQVPDANGALTSEPVLLHFRRVSPGYLPLMGIPLLRGRQFETRDDSAAPRVAIISRALATRYFPDRDPIGQKLVRAATPPTPLAIVGVVGDVMDGGYEAPVGEAVYVPYSQFSIGQMSIVVQRRSSSTAALAAVRRALKVADPLVAASGTTTLDALVSQANALPRLRAAVLLGFSIVALLIAALGSYGVMRQLVASREREFAIRLVFGAVPTDLGRAVVSQVLRLTLPGVVAGLGGTWFAASALRPFVFGIDPRSVVILTLVSLTVLVLAALTALPTVIRAMRIDARAGIATA